MSDLGNELKKVESYDPVSKEWHRLSDMRVPRAYVGVAVLDGHIYAVGGLNEHQGSLNVVEQFDPETVSNWFAGTNIIKGLMKHFRI